MPTQKYEIGAVPPVTETVAAPSQTPKQVGFVTLTFCPVGPPVEPIFKLIDEVQPLASVIWAVYPPAHNALAVVPEAPLLHKVVYGVVPPEITAVAEPSHTPQFASVWVNVADNTDGSLTEADVTATQPAASVTVTV